MTGINDTDAKAAQQRTVAFNSVPLPPPAPGRSDGPGPFEAPPPDKQSPADRLAEFNRVAEPFDQKSNAQGVEAHRRNGGRADLSRPTIAGSAASYGTRPPVMAPFLSDYTFKYQRNSIE
jgi:hypothetical protein